MVALKGLQRAGIYCQPAISIEYQEASRCYLIRGFESGGATTQIGAYCGFVDEGGSPLSHYQPVQTPAVNGLHGLVLSPSLVRVQVFRSVTTCELLITRHNLASVEGRGRPKLQNSILFHGRHGTFDTESRGGRMNLQELVAPVFYNRSGEITPLPGQFHEAVLKVIEGACCVGCRHSHVLDLSSSGAVRSSASPEQVGGKHAAMEDKQQRAREDLLPRIEEVLRDSAASFWLKNALQSALARDPVDAANDAEILAHLLDRRCHQILDESS
jgi:hypothetical protein